LPSDGNCPACHGKGKIPGDAISGGFDDGAWKSTSTCPGGVVSVVVRYPVFGADGKLHPKFDPYPKSKFFKNGKPLKEAGVCPITNR
jgi:hypothetical protein